MTQIVHFMRGIGLVTTPTEDGQEFPGFRVMQNLRLSRGPARRRAGMQILERAGSDNACVDWNGSSQHAACAVDTRVWTLGTQFTIKMLVNADSTSGTRPVFYAGSTTPSIAVDISSGNWRVRFWDSAAALTTVTSTASAGTDTTSLRITRDGATLSLYVDNGAADTGSITAANVSRTPVGSLYLAYDGTNRFSGRIDHVTVANIVIPDLGDDHMRWPDPYACPYITCDIDGSVDGNDYVWDRSRFENVMLATGSPSDGVALAVQHAPVQLIKDFVDENERRRAVVIAGGRTHLEDVG